MIWTTWRQHRAEAWVGGAILAAACAAMLFVGSIARDRAKALGLPTCLRQRRDCSDALGRLHDQFHWIPPLTLALIALPVVAGMFWAAPLVSREFEAGTHRLAWTQSVSPLRWIKVKITLIFAVVTAAALGLGLLAIWTLDPLTAAFGGRFNSTWYDVQGIVPVACMLFALAVGVAASALMRRTIPAMVLTLVAYLAARAPIHWLRWCFAPLTTQRFTDPLASMLDNVTGSPRDSADIALPTNAWLHNVSATGPSGQAISDNEGNFDLLRRYCPHLQPNPSRDGVLNPGACAARVHNLSLHQTITYQPASHFWLIQIIESAIYIGAAAALVTVALLTVARRSPT